MAQANTAQREPSMEEILASIRRIIEDSDGDKKREPEIGAANLGSPANDTREPADEADAFRADLQHGEFAEAPVFQAALDDAPLEETQGDLAETGRIESDAPFASAASFEIPMSDESLLQGEAPGQDFDLDLDGFAEETATVAGTPETEITASEQASSEFRPTIVSERTGRQVAAAFGELSEAFAASRRRSFDEMAEEMLRPMLQDWLDNNLPHMVERLVREEIERIARG